jgi:protein-disulfide isomerase
MNEKKYRIILWSSVIGALALVVGGMIWIATGAYQKPVYVPGVNEITADDHVTGKADSAVTMVEYADYQCPACAEFYPIVRKLEENYGDRVRFVYRNFPIPGHPNGRPVAYAVEAAALQGKFYEMQNQVFTHQAEWSSLDAGTLSKTLESYAQGVGLDVGKFRSDKSSDAVKVKVDKDAQSGINSGVDSTPSFFLNGVKLKINSINYDEFVGKLDAALQPQP